jgi:hypothetical protein
VRLPIRERVVAEHADAHAGENVRWSASPIPTPTAQIPMPRETEDELRVREERANTVMGCHAAWMPR